MARERERLHVSLSLCLNVKIAHAIISDEKVGTEWICFNITDMEYHIERGRRGAGLLCLCSHSGKALTGVLLYAQVYVRVRQLVFAQTCESVCVCMCVRALEDVKCVCACVCVCIQERFRFCRVPVPLPGDERGLLTLPWSGLPALTLIRFSLTDPETEGKTECQHMCNKKTGG